MWAGGGSGRGAGASGRLGQGGPAAARGAASTRVGGHPSGRCAVASCQGAGDDHSPWEPRGGEACACRGRCPADGAGRGRPGPARVLGLGGSHFLSQKRPRAALGPGWEAGSPTSAVVSPPTTSLLRRGVVGGLRHKWETAQSAKLGLTAGRFPEEELLTHKPQDHERQHLRVGSALPALTAHARLLHLPGPAAGAGPAAQRPGALGVLRPPAPVDGGPRLHAQPGHGRPLPALRPAIRAPLPEAAGHGHAALPALAGRLPGQQVHEHQPGHGHRRGPLRGPAAPADRPQAALAQAGGGRVRRALAAGGRLAGAPQGAQRAGGRLLLHEPVPAQAPDHGLLAAGLLPAAGRAGLLLRAGGGRPGPEAARGPGPGGGHAQGRPHDRDQPGRVRGLLPAHARGADVEAGRGPQHLCHEVRPLRHQQGLGCQLLPGRHLLLLHGQGVPGGVHTGRRPPGQGPQEPGLPVCPRGRPGRVEPAPGAPGGVVPGEGL